MNKNTYTNFNFKNYSSSGAASAQHFVLFRANVGSEKHVSDIARKRKKRRRNRVKNLPIGERMKSAISKNNQYELPYIKILWGEGHTISFILSMCKVNSDRITSLLVFILHILTKIIFILFIVTFNNNTIYIINTHYLVQYILTLIFYFYFFLLDYKINTKINKDIIKLLSLTIKQVFISFEKLNKLSVTLFYYYSKAKQKIVKIINHCKAIMANLLNQTNDTLQNQSSYSTPLLNVNKKRTITDLDFIEEPGSKEAKTLFKKVWESKQKELANELSRNFKSKYAEFAKVNLNTIKYYIRLRYEENADLENENWWTPNTIGIPQTVLEKKRKGLETDIIESQNQNKELVSRRIKQFDGKNKDNIEPPEDTYLNHCNEQDYAENDSSSSLSSSSSSSLNVTPILESGRNKFDTIFEGITSFGLEGYKNNNRLRPINKASTIHNNPIIRTNNLVDGLLLAPPSTKNIQNQGGPTQISNSSLDSDQRHESITDLLTVTAAHNGISENRISTNLHTQNQNDDSIQTDKPMEVEIELFSKANHWAQYNEMMERILTIAKNKTFIEADFISRIELLGRDDYLKYLEYTYRKESYTVSLVGRSKLTLSNIGSNINERKKEIVKWSGISSISVLKVLENRLTNEMIINVTVKKFEDYITLLGNWGTKAFGIGVYTYRAPLDEHLIIDKVPNSSEYNINCSKNQQTIGALKSSGLVDVVRESYEKIDFKTKLKTTILKNQLKCKAEDMLIFLETQYNSILLDMTSQEHNVYPETNRINTCGNCGKFNSHNVRNCPSPTICTKCLLMTHTIETCNSSFIKCINCNKPHSCNFKACWSVVNETKKNHSFIFNILLGEKVKKNPYEVLNLGEYYTEEGMLEVRDQAGCDPEMIADMIQQHANGLHERLDDQEVKIINNTKQVTYCIGKIQKHDEQLELHQKLLQEHSEVVNKLSMKVDDVQKTSTEILSSQNSLSSSIKSITDINASIASTLLGLKASVEAMNKK
jgi:hypothetical protein